VRLSDIAAIVPVSLVREGSFSVMGFVTHSGKEMLGFLDDRSYLDRLHQNPNVSSVLTTEEFVEKVPLGTGVAVSENPRRDFYVLHNHLARRTDFYGSGFPNWIAPDARISPSAWVAEQGVRIGRRVVIEPGVVVFPNTIIGDDVIVRAGSVIATEGFEFKRFGKEILPVSHAGGVRLGDRVELQANCTVSRSLFGGFTEVGEDSKFDNLVHIAHNVKIGRRCLVAAMAMFAGSVTLGDDVWIGPGASISSDVVIGDGASVTVGSVVTRNVEPGQHVTGNFAIEHSRFMTFLKTIR
jgi:UDP-3-O-[3-hydroxymyristoyl] glucosamine N-acyltransferase